MTATKTNERPGTRATLANSNMAPNKVREVLNLIRDVEYDRAADILAHTDRAAATVVAKLLHSCAANAEHNDGLDPRELYVATCYADEGTTLKRWRPRARGRATRIRKRSSHITIILARMPDEKIARRRARIAAEAADRRSRRVAGTRRREASGQAAVETPEEVVADEQLLEAFDDVTTSDAPETDVLDTDVEVDAADAARNQTRPTTVETDAVESSPTQTGPSSKQTKPVVEAAEVGTATDGETEEEDGN